MFHPSIIPWETGDATNVNWNALPKPLVPPAAVWPAPQRPKDFAPPAMEHNVPRRWSPPSLVTRVVAMWAMCRWICGALAMNNLGEVYQEYEDPPWDLRSMLNWQRHGWNEARWRLVEDVLDQLYLATQHGLSPNTPSCCRWPIFQGVILKLHTQFEWTLCNLIPD